MPLLLLDLDNTLIDRDAAWRRGLDAFLREHGLPTEDVEWVMRIDRSGHAPRSEVVDLLRERYGDALPEDELWEFLRWGAADNVEPDPAVLASLRTANEAGWRPVIVTNGPAAQQSVKVRNARLNEVVAGCVISQVVGASKPDPAIFRAAADVVGGSLAGAWMIGDTADADIKGAVGLGLPAVWLHRGRTWPSDLDDRPTRIAENVVEAITFVVTSA